MDQQKNQIINRGSGQWIQTMNEAGRTEEILEEPIRFYLYLALLPKADQFIFELDFGKRAKFSYEDWNKVCFVQTMWLGPVSGHSKAGRGLIVSRGADCGPREDGGTWVDTFCSFQDVWPRENLVKVSNLVNGQKLWKIIGCNCFPNSNQVEAWLYR